MEYSPLGFALTKRSEGLRLEAYLDVNGYSIGYGHHAANIYKGMTCTYAQADAWLQEDVKAAVDAVNANVKTVLNQNQFDALVDFTFNEGVASFAGSTLLKLVNSNNFVGAANEFSHWIYSGHEPNKNLAARRKLEHDLFLTPVGSVASSTPTPVNSVTTSATIKGGQTTAPTGDNMTALKKWWPTIVIAAGLIWNLTSGTVSHEAIVWASANPQIAGSVAAALLAIAHLLQSPLQPKG
ncbi:MAG: lysozyme [Patescibacteria group bacterium]|nr:lysozyme [Patescibacteria group bacterium]